MNHLLVLGAGKMGIVLAKDLIESDLQNRVTLVDIRSDHLEEARRFIASSRLEVVEGNMEDEEQRRSVFKGKTIVINALLHKHSLPALETAVRSGLHFVDLVGEAPLPRMAYDREAKARGVTVLSGMGLSPGITNVLVGRAVRLLDETKSAISFCGGNPITPRPPLSYRIVYSIDSLINFYQRPARIIRGGQMEEVAPLSGLEPIGFPPDFPDMECFFTDGLGSLLHTMKGKIREDLYKKTIRYRGHVSGFKTLQECGFFAPEPIEVRGQQIIPRQFTEALLEEKMKLGEEEDVTLLRIRVSGKKDGLSQTHIFEMVDRYDPQKKYTSMARTTSFPASIASQMIDQGLIPDKGVVFPENVFDGELYSPFLEGLKKRGVVISHEIVSEP